MWKCSRHAIFGGEISIIKSGSASKLLISFIKAHLAEIFSDVSSPELASRSIGAMEVMRRTDELSKKIFCSIAIRRCCVAMIAELGINPCDILLDTPRLRCVPCLSRSDPLPMIMYGVHRDTWFGEPQSQINIWTPIYDIDESRSFAFYPRYFNQPIENSSHTFDIDVEVDPIGRTNSHPAPIEDINDLRQHFVASAGDAVIFSAAHLHGTTRNTSELDRFAIQLRIVNFGDLQNGSGAPNVDNFSKGSTAKYMKPAMSWLDT